MPAPQISQKTDEQLREDLDRLRKRIRNTKALAKLHTEVELANCMLGILDLLTDAGL